MIYLPGSKSWWKWVFAEGGANAIAANDEMGTEREMA
jgi:hypothetical protein